MNRDTICVQGGYTPGNGEPRQIPIIQSTTFKYATSTPACRTPPAIWWRKRSASWKAAPPPC